ncbi:hypothetical protein ACFLQN_01625 [Candidatus Aenigmatarchaeota archaeon]
MSFTTKLRPGDVYAIFQVGGCHRIYIDDGLLEGFMSVDPVSPEKYTNGEEFEVVPHRFSSITSSRDIAMGVSPIIPSLDSKKTEEWHWRKHQ